MRLSVMVLVNLQTLHKQQVYEMTTLVGKQERLEQKLYDQRVELSESWRFPAGLRKKLSCWIWI
jgi:hypothetical protein